MDAEEYRGIKAMIDAEFIQEMSTKSPNELLNDFQSLVFRAGEYKNKAYHKKSHEYMEMALFIKGELRSLLSIAKTYHENWIK